MRAEIVMFDCTVCALYRGMLKWSHLFICSLCGRLLSRTSLGLLCKLSFHSLDFIQSECFFVL